MTPTPTEGPERRISQQRTNHVTVEEERRGLGARRVTDTPERRVGERRGTATPEATYKAFDDARENGGLFARSGTDRRPKP